jgi:uncharacterized membrane protein
MKTISIGAAIKHGWVLYKAHWSALSASLLVLVILQSVAGNHGGYNHMTGLTILIAILAWVAVTIVKIGWLKMTLMIEEGGKPKWTEIFAHAELFVKFAIASFLYALGTGVFMILLIIPGIYFALKYAFVPILVIDTELGILESFKRSSEMTDGHKWKLLALFIVLVLLTVLGAIVFVVGLIVAIPVSALAYAHIYRLLLGKAASEAPEMAL